MKTRIILFAMLLVGNLFSQSYLDVIRPFYGMSGRSGAESGVGPATTMQSNAMLGNPALLSYSDKSFIAADLSFDQVTGTGVFNSITSDPSQNTELRLNSLSYIYPVHVYRGAWVWGFNLQQVNSFQSNLEFDNTDFQDSQVLFTYDQRLISTGNLYALTAGTSFLATMNTSFGFAISYLKGDNTYDKVYHENDFNDVYTYDRYIDSLLIAPSYRGFSARVGVASELTETVRLAASVEFPSRISVDESSSIDSIEWLDSGLKDIIHSESISGLEYTVWGPWRLGVGVGFLVDPLEVSVNYKLHTFPTSFMKSNLIDTNGNSIDDKVGEQIRLSVQNVHEFSASVLWSSAPMNVSFAATVMNDPLKYHLGNSIRLDAGIAYQFISGIGFSLAFRNEQWQSDINYPLGDKVEIQNSFSQFQFGLKYIL